MNIAEAANQQAIGSATIARLRAVFNVNNTKRRAEMVDCQNFFN